ncbi:catalase [Nakamurella aerolata]|uniref:Catalase n=1 Tax=Nakamurella aerolata TaxID=1656892 RepID=A0A849AE90_9ACTN|nr:catalase [Nakamurella aerolata]NNG35182.1 catalase [Nakamurella aerolata]
MPTKKPAKNSTENSASNSRSSEPRRTGGDSAGRRKTGDAVVPGVPASEPPSLAEPTKARDPLPPKADQQGPANVSPTGADYNAPPETNAQQGRYLTTSTGVRLGDTDHSLKAGPRGPVLLQDHHLREKITHFDHERIPERVVHARGAAAHGTFVANGAAAGISKAGFLAKGVETPVFVRFSTVLGSRGSADTVRDTRGFATKFYTDEGIYDLVGNNIPVFFIQDGIKFPDLIHAGKPQPDREIPQAQSAHDTFWDFVSLHTEAQHHTLWNMSDRALPASFRTMEGFGLHTFRMINDAGETCLVKFHWKPRQGVHSQTWEEAQLTQGLDPDFHRRDLADAIEAGVYPVWDLGVQVMPDNDEQTFSGIDLLDPTKLVPEELAEVQIIGTMTLNRNPINYFAETEQVMFNPGHLVPGIDVTNDPLLQARLFSYIDTQLSRLGGPNFSQLPINRPHAAVNDLLRDGSHQDAVPGGVAAYRPNSLDGGCPFTASTAEGAFIDIPTEVHGAKVRELSESFEDHYTQCRLFYASLGEVEKQHVIAAYTFELAKCYEENIKLRQLGCLANIDAELCQQVAAGLGLPAPKPTEKLTTPEPSPALSQLGGRWPVAGRRVGVVVGADTDPTVAAAVADAVRSAGMLPLLIAPTGGTFGKQAIQRSYLTAASVELDAAVLAGLAAPADDAFPARDSKAGHQPAGQLDPRVVKLFGELFRQAKPIGVLDGLDDSGIADVVDLGAPGVATGSASAVVDELTELLAQHRMWQRG